jgi:hypothetical protein
MFRALQPHFPKTLNDLMTRRTHTLIHLYSKYFLATLLKDCREPLWQGARPTVCEIVLLLHDDSDDNAE